jgi:arylsulfatase A-like enzyme
VRCPDLIPGGQRTDALLSFIDMVPTLLDLVGVNPSPLAPDGISQKTVLTGASETLRNNLTVTHFGKGAPSENPDIHSLITPEWKLNYYAGDGNGELYHLQEDPQELNNLYHNPAVESVQRELTHKLLDELILVKDKSYEHRIKNADHYGRHTMHYDEWKSELEEV